MPILELETPEATYRNDMARGCHFMIDCACGGTDREYHGSHYKNADRELEEMTEEYGYLSLSRHSKSKHTFFLSEEILLQELYLEHIAEEGGKPLVIICNDCGREFPFTHESYLDLRTRMMIELNKRSAEKEKTPINS